MIHHQRRKANATFMARSAERHASSTIDPDARLFREGRGEGREDLPHGTSENGEPQWADANRRSALDARATRRPGYRIRMTERKRIQQPFGWIKTVVCLRTTRSWPPPGRVVVGAYRCRLQSLRTHGTNLSGASDMRRNHNENCACGAAYHASIGSSSPHTTAKNRPSGPILSAAC